MPPVDPNDLSQDKDFAALTPADQKAYLSSQDQDYAKLSPEDQVGYLRHLTGNPASIQVGLAPAGGKPPKELANEGQPSVGDVLTQPTEKTDKEYLGYKGPAGVAGATVHGLSDVARGTQGAVMGPWGAVRHPIETVKGIAQLPAMAAQVPSAIHDINESPDATERYMQVAQDTASQGAGQALTALGAAGASRMIAPAIRLGARAAEAGINQKLVPVRPIFNLSTPADDAAAVRLKIPGRDF